MNSPTAIDYAQTVGRLYGVEHISIFLYSLIRMQQPHQVVEIGTGTGACALMCAKAMKENGHGETLTLDDGRDWPQLRERKEIAANCQGPLDYPDFIAELARRYCVAEHLKFIAKGVPPFHRPDGPIDLLFSDVAHDPGFIYQLLGFYLPLMSESASVFIDSASTYTPSFFVLERLAGALNSGKIPSELSRAVSDFPSLLSMISARKFTLVHLTEASPRSQNSTAWLKIEPLTDYPNPPTVMRG